MNRKILQLLYVPLLAIPGFLLPQVASAQAPQAGAVPNFNGQPGQKQERISIDGKLTAAQGKFIQVAHNDNQPWYIRVDSKPDQIIVRGEAEKDWVRPGMFVTFEAVLDKRGNGQAPVSQATVFTPTPEIQLGITEAGALPSFGEENAAPAEPTAETATYTVVGRLTNVGRDGRWNVTAGRDRAAVEIADDAKISVELPDPTLIRIGDTVKGTAVYYNQGAGIFKDLVEVEAAQPFAAPEEKKRPRRGRDRKEDDTPVNPSEAKSIFDMGN